ncbi:MAG: GTPase HflX [Oscillospiraceae bacterium]|nr:GTPase HflX [Oscillospiraceae bacterium]
MDSLSEDKMERAILVGLNAAVFTKEETATEQTLDELEALLETAGGTCCCKVLQNRPAPDSHSFLGEGKVDEVRELVTLHEATMVIFDNDLTPSQIRALTEALGVPVLERSGLILDIFAQRAQTREGRLQVELAQYQYLLPKLSGMGQSMSRLGGGIGTRGPGESKLETDRRHIRERITKLKEDLREVRKNRAVQRERRIKNSVPTVAIVGYTNAGKSTLLNCLTGAGISANNRLFDTLDTTARQLTVSDTLSVIISDTVGFIAKLPHNLVDAFRATLEELQYADLLLHVIDASDPERDDHIAVAERLIAQLAKPGVPVLEVYNKADCVAGDDIPRGENRIAICAKSGEGIDALCKLIEHNLGPQLHHARFLLPYAMAGQLDTLHCQAKVLASEYTPEGIRVEAVCDDLLYGRLRACLLEDLHG